MQPVSPRSSRHASFYGRIGVAQIDITPPTGVYARNWGAAKHDVATSIHRPLLLTALTLRSLDSDQSLVLVEADLGWWKAQQTCHDFRRRLLAECSLESADVIFALSHTHSGPPLMDADESVPGGELHRTWMERLFDSTVRAVRQSMNSQFAGVIDWHAGRCGLAANRDLPHPDRSEQRMICGYNPAGAADDFLLVGRVTDEDQRIRATIVNYACHPTTLAWENAAISPDYVGAMRQTLLQATGAPALFLLGACGELAPRVQYVSDLDIADRHGVELGHAALSTLHGMDQPGTQLSFSGVVESGAPLATWEYLAIDPSQALRSLESSVEIPLKHLPSVAELQALRERCTNRTQEERLLRQLNIRLAVGDGKHFQLGIHAWRIGDAVIVGSCCEAYSSLQRELRSRFPDTAIVCMNLINGSLGYLPPAELYDVDVYSVWQTPFDRGSLERVTEAMEQAICEVLS